MSRPDPSPTTGVVITGGASGIGRASAEALAEVGRPVALWDLDGAQADAAAERIRSRFGVPACAIAIDVRDRAAYPEAIHASREAMGSIGGLVHSAGVSAPHPMDDLDDERWDLVLDTNLRPMAFLAKALLSDLCRNPGSAIVGIASVNAILGNRANPAYGASKAGLLGLLRSLADRFAPEGVRVNGVCPGYVRTPMLEAGFEHAPGLRSHMEQQAMLGRLAEPEEIGTVVRFLLSDDARFITAEHVVVDGGAVRSQR